MMISFVNQKGGVGKTTTAINLASSLARKHHSVVLVDLDPKGDAAKWHAIEGNLAFKVIHQPSIAAVTDIEKMSYSHDFVIIDSPSVKDDATWKIVSASNLVVMPVSPGSLDLWACTDTLKMIKEVQQLHSELEAAFLINQTDTDAHSRQEAREALGSFETRIFKTELCKRRTYVEAMKNGVSVIQFAPHGKAAVEIQQFCEELLRGYRHSHVSEPSDVTPITALYREDSDNHLFHDYQAL